MARVGGDTVRDILNIAGYSVEVTEARARGGTGRVITRNPAESEFDVARNKFVDRTSARGVQKLYQSHNLQVVAKGNSYTITSATGVDEAALGAIVRNTLYVNQVEKVVARLSAGLRTAQRRRVKKYYNPATGQYQIVRPTTPSGTQGNKQRFLDSARTLADLVANKVVDLNTKLDVRPINLETGEFATPDETLVKQKIAEEAFAFVTSGVITRSKRATNVDKFGHTFTSVDIEVTAIHNNLIVPVKGLNSISWSLHRDKQADRTLNEGSPKRRSRGAKTYAGTMIFSLFGESPARAISPVEYFRGFEPIAPPSGFIGTVENDSVDLPPFDLYITFTNEYGSTATMVIWGVEFVDEGGAITTRQVENEVSFQYVAAKIDPIKPTRVDEAGQIAFLDGSMSSAENIEKQRTMILMSDYAGANFESIYKRNIDEIYNKLF